MIDTPKQKRAMDTRKRILQAGLKLFTEDGYHQTSSKKIAAQAGVATGTFYNHFEDKKALLLELHNEHVASVHSEIAAFFDRISTTKAKNREQLTEREIMREMVALILRTHQFGPALHRELHILSFTDADFAHMAQMERESGHNRLKESLAPFWHKLRVKDKDTATILVGMTIETVVHSIVMDQPPVAAQRLTEALTDMLHRYLFK